MESLATKIVQALKDIDHEQSEGGIYALPDRYSKGRWPAGHHHVFGGHYAKLDLLARLGIKGRERRNSRMIEFATDEGAGYLQFADIALTKIRSYGSRFQLDRHHGKKREHCADELMELLSGFIKKARKPWNTEAGLFVALIFTDSEKHAESLIAPSTDEAFLSRYGVTHAKEIWKDPHARGIWTCVVCWECKIPIA